MKTIFLAITFVLFTNLLAQSKPDSTEILVQDSTDFKFLTEQLNTLQNEFNYTYNVLKNNETIVAQNKARLYDLSQLIGELQKAIITEKKKLGLSEKETEVQ